MSCGHKLISRYILRIPVVTIVGPGLHIGLLSGLEALYCGRRIRLILGHNPDPGRAVNSTLPHHSQAVKNDGKNSEDIIRQLVSCGSIITLLSAGGK